MIYIEKLFIKQSENIKDNHELFAKLIYFNIKY